MPGHICSLNTPLLSQADKFRVSRLRWHGTPRAGVPGSRRGSARKSYWRPLPAPAGVRYGAVVAECHFSPSLTWHKSTRTWQAEVVTNMLQKNGGLPTSPLTPRRSFPGTTDRARGGAHSPRLSHDSGLTLEEANRIRNESVAIIKGPLLLLLRGVGPLCRRLVSASESSARGGQRAAGGRQPAPSHSYAESVTHVDEHRSKTRNL